MEMTSVMVQKTRPYKPRSGDIYVARGVSRGK
jgi:hypothetical protein